MQRLAIEPEQCNGSTLHLTAAQSHYLRRVLRLRAGDRFLALDGRGAVWQADLTETGAQLGDRLVLATELPVSVTLLVGLPKGSGFEEIVRSGTELGAAALVPVLAARSLLRPSPQKVARWRRIAREAAEQCERAVVPAIAEPVSLEAAIAQLAPETRGYVCAARGDRPHLSQALEPGARAVAIASGPEGGWTGSELTVLAAQGFQPVSLGRRVLRAVTAPLAAIALVAAAADTNR